MMFEAHYIPRLWIPSLYKFDASCIRFKCYPIGSIGLQQILGGGGRGRVKSCHFVT